MKKRLPACLCLVLLASCRGEPESAEKGEPASTEAPSCPAHQIRETRAPDVRPEHEQAEHWLTALAGVDHDAELLDAASRTMLAARVAELEGGWRDPTRPDVGDPTLIDKELRDRLAWLRERVAAGKYVETSAGALERAAGRIGASVAIQPSPALRFVVSETPLWCAPTREGLYTEPVDLDFDRNRCASLHPGELIAALRSTPDGAWLYVEAGHSVGWIDQTDETTLGPAITAEAARAQLDAQPRVRMLADFEQLRAGSSFALLGRDGDSVTIAVPGPDGTIERELPSGAPIHEGPLPFTRRAVFTQAFALLEQPYGWGGRDGHRDCSSYLLDVFAQFDVRLPRNSAVQAQLGTKSVDLSELDEARKIAAIREAAREGVVLLYMPGHILMYLGHEGERDYGLSALSEFLTPCEGGPDTVHRLDKVAVTTLSIGRGTERKAFIERITRMAVFGPPVAEIVAPSPNGP